MMVSHFTAISMTDVAYMISVKRTSLIMSVLRLGSLFKKRKSKRGFWEHCHACRGYFNNGI